MTAVLLALVFAQPAPDETCVQQNLVSQLTEASRLMATDPQGAIRHLNAMLDDPEAQKLEEHSPTIHVYREQALYFRAGIQLSNGQAQTVADDMTELLDRKRVSLLAQITGLMGTLASPLPDAPFAAAIRLPKATALNRMEDYQALGLRRKPTRNWDRSTRRWPTARR